MDLKGCELLRISVETHMQCWQSDDTTVRDIIKDGWSSIQSKFMVNVKSWYCKMR